MSRVASCRGRAASRPRVPEKIFVTARRRSQPVFDRLLRTDVRALRENRTANANVAYDLAGMPRARVLLIGLAACGRLGFDAVPPDDFASGGHLGTRFDPGRGMIVLGEGGGCDGSATNCAELDASWAPQWDRVVGYWRFEGVGNLADGDVITAIVGPDGVASNADGAGTSYGSGK